jgi:hypothetical protein
LVEKTGVQGTTNARSGRGQPLSGTKETWLDPFDSVTRQSLPFPIPIGVFDPYDLVLAADDDWCLIGYCHLRNDIRLFKFQRVRSAVETGECFCRPAGFRARDYRAESFGTIRGDGDFHVVLRFTQAYTGRIAEKQWHAS